MDTVEILEESHTLEEASYVVKLPNGNNLIFTAHIEDCHCKDSYIEAKLVEEERSEQRTA